MSNSEIIGRAFSSNIVGTKDENNDWKVIINMIEKRLVDGEDWEKKELSAMCTHREFQKSYVTAMRSVLEQFNTLLEENKNDSMFPTSSELIIKE